MSQTEKEPIVPVSSVKDCTPEKEHDPDVPLEHKDDDPNPELWSPRKLRDTLAYHKVDWHGALDKLGLLQLLKEKVPEYSKYEIKYPSEPPAEHQRDVTHV